MVAAKTQEPPKFNEHYACIVDRDAKPQGAGIIPLCPMERAERRQRTKTVLTRESDNRSYGRNRTRVASPRLRAARASVTMLPIKFESSHSRSFAGAELLDL